MDASSSPVSRASRTAICSVGRMGAPATMILLIAAFALQAHSQATRLNVAGVWDGNFFGDRIFTLCKTVIVSGASSATAMDTGSPGGTGVMGA